MDNITHPIHCNKPTQEEMVIIRIKVSTKCRLMRRMTVGESFDEAINKLMEEK